MTERPNTKNPDRNAQAPERHFFIPLEEKIPMAEIKNVWEEKGKPKIYRVELPHNDHACDPTSDCKGTISVTFNQNKRGERESICRRCEKQVKVSITVLKIELRLL